MLSRITLSKVARVAALLVGVFVMLLGSAVGYAASRQEGQASSVASPAQTPQAAGPDTTAPIPPYRDGQTAQAQPAAVSPNLSYSFVPGSAFTPDIGTSPYVRQVTGCVNQMPLGWPFSAPVYLPQGAQVISITLYTYDSALTTTVGSAIFLFSDSAGISAYYLSASSQPNVSGYQQHPNAFYNPAMIDNEHYSYSVQWRTSGTYGSPYLSLCGVRITYHAPLGAMYLPVVVNGG